MESKVAERRAPAEPESGPAPRRSSRITRRIIPLTLAPPAETRGPAASKRRDTIFRRSLFAADCTAVLAALVATVALSPTPLHFKPAILLGLPILLVCAKLFGLYDRDDSLVRKTTLDEAPTLLQLATLSALGTWFAGALVVRGGPNRHQALLLWMVLVGLLLLLRTLARALALRTAPEERCLVIGDATVTQALRSKLTGRGGIRSRVVAQVDLEGIAPWSTDAGSHARLSEVRELARELDVHRAIVAPRSADAGEVLDLVRTLKAVGVRVSVLPRMLEVVGTSVEFDHIHGLTLMGVRRFELTRSSAAVKRCFDLLCASIGLLAVSPLMLLAAVAIRLESSGPVFFRQVRVGRYGARFGILKFRTMVEEAETMKDALRERVPGEEGLFKLSDDPRVTRVGRLLRKSSLDELPQLINILRGEMSVVGPRPLVLDEDERVQGWHRRRLELKPGLTGPWQILGPVRVPLSEMVVIDYLYAANWSLWADVKIMVRTVVFVLSARGL